MPIGDVIEAVKDHKKRAERYDLYRDYEEGRHKHPFASRAAEKRFGWIIKQARLNACYMVRSNFTDLVQIQAWAGTGADKANELSETTDLPMVLDLAFNESWRCGDAYILAWPGKDGEVRPWYHRADQSGFRLDPEDPSTTAVQWKLWIDGDGFGRVNLYYPDLLERWVTLGKVRLADEQAIEWEAQQQENAWGPFDRDGEPDTQTHTFGRVPWIHLPFDPQTQGGHGRSILRDVIPPQDGLNHTIHALLSNTEWYGKVMAGLLNHQDDATLNPVTGQVERSTVDLDQTQNSIFGFKGPGPLVQLDPPNSQNLIAVKQSWHTDIANTVGIPVSDIVPDLGNIPSGAALRVLASRRTNTVRAYTKSIRGRVTTLMELLGVPDAVPEFIDPAPMDDTERLANAQARMDLGYPLSEVLPDLGENEDSIRSILESAAREQATMAAAGAAAIRAARENPEVMGDGER